MISSGTNHSGRRSRAYPGALGVLALLLASCRSVPKPALEPGQFHVAIVVLDACRADKLGCYGFDQPTTPELDALARDPDTVLFRRHYVQGSWTKPSTASLFTGQFVHTHGVLLGHEPSEPGPDKTHYRTQVLPAEHVTLAERMKGAGYATFGIVKSRHLIPDYGFAQGFDRYVTPADLSGDDERVARFLTMASESPGRFFAYLHLNACHHPFKPAHRDADYLAREPIAYDEDERRRAGVDFTVAEVSSAIKEGKVHLTLDDVRFLNRIYESQLRWTDRTLVAPLIAGLRERGLYDDTLLIVTADHGEELYDHQGYGHGHALWEELIHVPLLVKFPKGRRPQVLSNTVEAPTRAIDLASSILDYLGAPGSDGLPGVALFRGATPEFVMAETADAWTMLVGREKLIAHRRKGALNEERVAMAKGDAAASLFFLDQDPGERSDAAGTAPARVLALTALAEDQFARDAGKAIASPIIETTLDKEAEENLRSLGYLR